MLAVNSGLRKGFVLSKSLALVLLARFIGRIELRLEPQSCEVVIEHSLLLSL